MSRIMIIDDDPAGQRLVKLMLAAEGHEFTTASNGIQGLQIASENVPDLIVLDVMLPGLDGFEVCRRLRASSNTERIPVIMLSGKSNISDQETGLKMGANAYLIKPVNRKEFVEVTKRLLEVTRKKKHVRARMIAFIGARGGAGTTTVAINTAVALAGDGYNTILVDLNPSFGIIPELMGLETDKPISGLFKDVAGTIDSKKLEAGLLRHSSGVRVLSSDQLYGKHDDITSVDMNNLLQELGNMADFVIIDIPSSATDLNIAALMACDNVAVVTGAEPETLKRIEGSLNRLYRLNIKRSKLSLVVVDRSGSGIDDGLLSSTVPGDIPVIGKVHSDAKLLADAEANGRPVVIAVPSSQISNDLRNVAKRILDMK